MYKCLKLSTLQSDARQWYQLQVARWVDSHQDETKYVSSQPTTAQFCRIGDCFRFDQLSVFYLTVYTMFFSLAEYQTLLFYISTFTSAQDTVTRRTFSNNRSYIGDNCSFFASLALERCLASNNINNMYNRCLIDQLYLISKPNSIYLHLVLKMQKTKHRSRCAEKIIIIQCYRTHWH